jgi:hypothetical protein
MSRAESAIASEKVIARARAALAAGLPSGVTSVSGDLKDRPFFDDSLETSLEKRSDMLVALAS